MYSLKQLQESNHVARSQKNLKSGVMGRVRDGEMTQYIKRRQNLVSDTCGRGARGDGSMRGAKRGKVTTIQSQ